MTIVRNTDGGSARRSWLDVPLCTDGQLAFARIVFEKQCSIALGSGRDIVERDVARFDGGRASCQHAFDTQRGSRGFAGVFDLETDEVSVRRWTNLADLNIYLCGLL